MNKEPYHWAEIWMELLPPEHGGRTQPLVLCNDHLGRYRPHLRVKGASEVLGVAFMDGPDKPVEPGTGTFATVAFLYEPGVSYTALSVGAEFEVLEGPHVVGVGRVTRR